MTVNESKWYHKLLIALIVVVFSPLIVVALVFLAVYTPIDALRSRKKYMKSRYCADINNEFSLSTFNSPGYVFYNSAVRRGLPIKYIKQESNGLEYFIFDGTLFLFPDFEQMDYDAEKEEWQVNYDGDWTSFDKAYGDILAELESDQGLPVRLLVSRETLVPCDLNDAPVPECIFLTWDYEDAFDDDDNSPLKMFIPETSEELYHMMLETPGLCGSFELSSDKGRVLWVLYENICIELGVDSYDCYFGVSKRGAGKVWSCITHWHPDPAGIYNEVRKIGKKGNVLVIRASPFSSEVLYMGSRENCPYGKTQKMPLGKIYFLEAK